MVGVPVPHNPYDPTNWRLSSRPATIEVDLDDLQALLDAADHPAFVITANHDLSDEDFARLKKRWLEFFDHPRPLTLDMGAGSAVLGTSRGDNPRGERQEEVGRKSEG